MQFLYEELFWYGQFWIWNCFNIIPLTPTSRSMYISYNCKWTLELVQQEVGGGGWVQLSFFDVWPHSFSNNSHLGGRFIFLKESGTFRPPTQLVPLIMHPKQQNYKKAYYILLDFVKELCFEVTIGHLRSFGGKGGALQQIWGRNLRSLLRPQFLR